MKKIEDLANYIQNLDEKTLKKNIILFVGATVLISFGITYYSYSESSTLFQKISDLTEKEKKADKIILDQQKIQSEEEKTKDLLEKNPSSNLNGFFEKFYKKHNVTPEQDWKTEDGRETEGIEEGLKIQEKTLKVIFKGQTTEKLVSMLEDIQKEQIVWVKDIEITKEESKKITIEMTIASRQLIKEESSSD
jgi:hypothetical protein